MAVKMIGSIVQRADLNIARPMKKTVDSIYLTKEWKQLMSDLITERGRRCEECGKMNVRIFGDHVHELKDGGAPFDPNNIMLLCGSHHTKKTLRVRNERMATMYRKA